MTRSSDYWTHALPLLPTLPRVRSIRQIHKPSRRRLQRLVCMLLLTAMPLVTTAGVVDGTPVFKPLSDTGLYVWRTWDGRWQLRVLAASGDQHATGTFQTGLDISSHRALALEADDVLKVSSERVVEFELRTARRTVDGLVFYAGEGGACLRSSAGLPIFLGRNATPASAPVDLTGSGACARPLPRQTNLVVERRSKVDWEVRLATDSEPVTFDGAFHFTEPPESVRQVSFEGGDWIVRPQPAIVRTHMEVWPGWYDGIDFTAVEFSRICLRSTTGREQVVSLLSQGQAAALRVTTPLDLTNNGACGPPTDPFPPPIYGRKLNAGHYVVLTRLDDDSTLAESVVSGVKGFAKRYSWRELEPSRGTYDFSEIEHDLALVSSYGLQLVAVIEDKSFRNVLPTPDYLRDRTLPNLHGGYTVARWDPFVVSRYNALITEVGRRFDANPRFEGIATEEAALSLEEAYLTANGYTPEKYRDALIDQLSHAARSLPKSRVFWFMNYLRDANWYMGEIARRVAPLGVVMGAPDVKPDERELQLHAYPFYQGGVGRMPLFGQVEPSCYHHPHADPNAPTTYWTPGELFQYARDELHVSYMFWVRWRWRLHADSYNWWDAIPVMGENPVFNRQ